MWKSISAKFEVEVVIIVQILQFVLDWGVIVVVVTVQIQENQYKKKARTFSISCNMNF